MKRFLQLYWGRTLTVLIILGLIWYYFLYYRRVDVWVPLVPTVWVLGVYAMSFGMEGENDFKTDEEADNDVSPMA